MNAAASFSACVFAGTREGQILPVAYVCVFDNRECTPQGPTCTTWKQRAATKTTRVSAINAPLVNVFGSIESLTAVQSDRLDNTR